MKGVYFIVNSINEIATNVSGYFSTLEEAKEALKDCHDWYRSNGTGHIYFVEFGLKKTGKLVYKK